jgi:uncharacterized protein (TIGR02284 family)
MAIDNDEVISTLNNLIETCKDGQNGFRTAAEGVKDTKLTTLFYTCSQQRGQFAAELQNEVRRLGGDPEKTGSTAAVLHRGWINIKSAVTGEDEGAVISECERGEDSAVGFPRQNAQAGGYTMTAQFDRDHAAASANLFSTRYLEGIAFPGFS